MPVIVLTRIANVIHKKYFDADCPLCLYKIGRHLSVFQRGALVQAYAIG